MKRRKDWIKKWSEARVDFLRKAMGKIGGKGVKRDLLLWWHKAGGVLRYEGGGNVGPLFLSFIVGKGNQTLELSNIN